LNKFKINITLLRTGVKHNFEHVHLRLCGLIVAVIQIGPNLLFTWVLPLLYVRPAHGVFP
jgi:uncharacterized membrane protein (DUF485 family)